MKRLLALVAVLVIMAQAASALEFKFINEVGRKYRFKNLNRQDVYRNGALYRSLESMNKAMLEVLDATNDLGYYQGKYYYYEKNLNINESFKLVSIYESRFLKDEFGHMTVPREILMPSVRSVPTFPATNLEPGDRWSAPGEEYHEGIFAKRNTFSIPVNVNYTYIGNETNAGKVYAKIGIQYQFSVIPPGDPDIKTVTGYARSTYYWDIENHAPSWYTEDYSFQFVTHEGEVAGYVGTTEGKMDLVSDITNREKLAIMQELSNRVTPKDGVSLREVTDGIVVSLGNILFDWNKAQLKKEFEKKLEALADVLRKYPQIDLVVSGHTDNTGNANYNKNLSESRAKNVADYLMKVGIAPSRISYIGHGDSQPLAENNTEAGRALNRRVEIKLITKE